MGVTTGIIIAILLYASVLFVAFQDTQRVKYIAELELSERAAVQRMIDAEEAMIKMMDEIQVGDQRFSDLQDNYKNALDRIRILERRQSYGE